MNKEEILAMEAGRKLDILISKEVMHDRFLRDYGLAGRPEYSTDISAAWQVVKKVNERYGIMLTIFDPSQIAYPLSKALCEINDPSQPIDKPTAIGKAYGDTAPEAICKAALLATIKGP